MVEAELESGAREFALLLTQPMAEEAGKHIELYARDYISEITADLVSRRGRLMTAGTFAYDGGALCGVGTSVKG